MAFTRCGFAAEKSMDQGVDSKSNAILLQEQLAVETLPPINSTATLEEFTRCGLYSVLGDTGVANEILDRCTCEILHRGRPVNDTLVFRRILECELPGYANKLAAVADNGGNCDTPSSEKSSQLSEARNFPNAAENAVQRERSDSATTKSTRKFSFDAQLRRRKFTDTDLSQADIAYKRDGNIRDEWHFRPLEDSINKLTRFTARVFRGGKFEGEQKAAPDIERPTLEVVIRLDSLRQSAILDRLKESPIFRSPLHRATEDATLWKILVQQWGSIQGQLGLNIPTRQFIQALDELTANLEQNIEEGFAANSEDEC